MSPHSAEVSRDRFIGAIEALSDFIGLADAHGHLDYLNRGGRRLLGLADDADLAAYAALRFHPPETLELLAGAGFPTAIRDGTWEGDGELLTITGDRIPVSILIVAHRVGDTTPLYFSAIIRDTRDRDRAERLQHDAQSALMESERRFRQILETLRGIAVMLDTDGRITFVNDSLLERTGWTRPEVQGQNWFTLFTPLESGVEAAFRAMIARDQVPPHFEAELVTRDGARRLIAWDTTGLRDQHGALIGTASIGQDVTEQRALQKQLAALSERDDLTGLSNRRGFRRMVEQELRIAKRTGRGGALLYIDVDRLKPINDTYGHAAGDLALQATADALRACVRDADFVARLGGDEFAIFATAVTSIAETDVLLGRLFQTLAAHNARATAAGRRFALSFSIGTALVERDDDLDALIRRADASLYVQKQARS